METYEAEVGEQLREYPNSWAGDDNSDDIEDQPYDGDGEEQSDECKGDHTEIPHAETKDGWPEGEHDSCQHDHQHSDSSDVCQPLRAFVEPSIVFSLLERLRLVDIEDLW